MSVKATSWVWQDERTQQLSGNRMVVMLALADIADDDGSVIYAKPGQRTQSALAEKCRVSRATLQRVIKSLEEDGLLIVERTDFRTTNRYQLAMHQNEASVSTMPQNEATAASPSEASDASTVMHIEHVSRSETNTPLPPKGGDTDVLFEKPEPKPDPFDELFDEVWKSYPTYRRGTKKVAKRALKTAIGAETPEQIMSVLHQHVEDWKTWPTSDQQFVPMLSTWLNQERWTGERPGKRGGFGVTQVAEASESGESAPYGLTPSGRPMGPPAQAYEHPRSPYMGLNWGINRTGDLMFNRKNPMSTRPLNERAARILRGGTD